MLAFQLRDTLDLGCKGIERTSQYKSTEDFNEETEPRYPASFPQQIDEVK
jgi:hypothetical protein